MLAGLALVAAVAIFIAARRHERMKRAAPMASEPHSPTA
jgi:hypothetical protein